MTTQAKPELNNVLPNWVNPKISPLGPLTTAILNKNKAIKLNKLKIAHYFLNYSKLIMNSLGIEPVEKM